MEKGAIGAYITVVGMGYYLGFDEYRLGSIFEIRKDKDNAYDAEALEVCSVYGEILGHVANSVHTVARGTCSAGRITRYIDDVCYGMLLFSSNRQAILKIVEGPSAIYEENDMYVTLVGMDHYLGKDEFEVGKNYRIRKDEHNAYDDEAVEVLSPSFAKIAMLANSRYTLFKGTRSAGYVYDDVADDTRVKVLFKCDKYIIGKIVHIE